MSNVTRWYATREATKAAIGQFGTDLDALVDSYIEAASADVEELLGRRFIPETATKYFRWPPRVGGGTVLDLGGLDLLAATTIYAAAQDAAPVEIVAADYFCEPVNEPPYQRIEIDLSSSAAFQSGDTPQRSISVLGRWGYCEDTKAAGALAAAIATTGATTCDVTDSSLIGIGDTILVGTEAMFVSGKALKDTTANTAKPIAASEAETTVAVNTGTLVKQGEVITIGSERMLVESISGNNLTVQRSYDGSVLAPHTVSDVYAPRTLTIVRGVNGTTAATHLIAAAIVKYAPPGDITEYCRAVVSVHHQQDRSGWSGVIGGSEGGAIETKHFGLWSLRQKLIEKYGRVSL